MENSKIDNIINNLREELKGYQFNLYKEKILQEQLFTTCLKKHGFIAEYRLDAKNIIDFYHPDLKIGIEVKIKGSPYNIYSQCKRYAAFNDIETIVLICSVAMSLPNYINDKKSYVINLSSSWL